MEPQYEVVWPLGPVVTEEFTPAPRLPDLTGKTVAQLSLGSFRSDEMFALLREELSQRYKGIKFIDQAIIGQIHGLGEREVIASMPSKLKEFGADAAISAVGA